MTEKSPVTLGKFFPPLWLLGAGALGTAALCVYIGASVLDVEKRRVDLEAKLEEHQRILADLPAMKQEFADLQMSLTDARSRKAALEKSLKELQTQEEEVRQLLARRDSAVAQLDEADRSLRLFRKQQQALLKEKTQAEQDRLALESAVARLRGERDGLSAGVEKVRNELADLQARTQAQQKLNELVRQEQKELEGFGAQVTASLGRFTTSVDALVETGRTLSEQGARMKQEAGALSDARAAMQKEYDGTLRSLVDEAAAGAAARKQTAETLRKQAEGIAAAAGEFSRQIAEGRKAVADAMTDMRNMRHGVVEADRAMKELTARAVALEKTRGDLEAAVLEVAERSRQLAKSVQDLSQESSGLREGRAGLDDVVARLQAHTAVLERRMKEMEGQSTQKNNETVVPVEHEPAQKQE